MGHLYWVEIGKTRTFFPPRNFVFGSLGIFWLNPEILLDHNPSGFWLECTMHRLRSSGTSIWGNLVSAPQLKRKALNTWAAMQDTYLSTKVLFLFFIFKILGSTLSLSSWVSIILYGFYLIVIVWFYGGFFPFLNFNSFLLLHFDGLGYIWEAQGGIYSWNFCSISYYSRDWLVMLEFMFICSSIFLFLFAFQDSFGLCSWKGYRVFVSDSLKCTNTIRCHWYGFRKPK